MGVRYVSSYINDDDDRRRVKKYYSNLRNNVRTVVERMQATVTYLDNIKSDFGSYYSIDGSDADNNSIDIAINELQTRIRYLTDKVIPSISNKIRNLN